MNNDLNDYYKSDRFPDKKVLHICHASYEPRSLAITNKEPHYQVKDSIVIYSNEFTKENDYKNNLESLQNYFSANNVATYAIAVHGLKNYPLLKSVANISENSHNSHSTIFFDISTFPSDRLLCLMSYFIKRKRNIIIKYVEPEYYSPEMDNNGWLCRGVNCTVPVHGFNGFQHPTKNSLLIILLDNEVERAVITTNHLEPDNIIVIHTNRIERTSRIKLGTHRDVFTNVLSVFYAKKIIKSVMLETIDLHEIRTMLENIVKEFVDDFNIIISPNGTKIHTLAVLLTCMKYKQPRIIYSQPQEYNSNSYSNGIGAMWSGHIIYPGKSRY